ncbi:MAG: adenylylsulfate kinase-like enzyme [Myxococcota bacterium]|jgi:adenylylsulfate kinase-like enzyme
MEGRSLHPFEDITPGAVYWLTGLAGAGKTTVARRLFSTLRDRNANVILLDGDILREVYGDSPGHHMEGRRIAAWRHAHMCHMLSQQGIDVVIATISMFHEIHAWNRAHMSGYREVYLEVPMKTLRERDQKSLYSKAFSGEMPNVLGVDLIPEYPASPHVQILNDGSRSVDEVLADCLRQLEL